MSNLERDDLLWVLGIPLLVLIDLVVTGVL